MINGPRLIHWVSYNWCCEMVGSWGFWNQSGCWILFLLAYNVVLVSAVHQNKSAICIHTSPPLGTILFPLSPATIHFSQLITEHQADSLGYTAASHTSYFTQGSGIYIWCSSLDSPRLSFSPRSQVCSLYLHLYSCPADSTDKPIAVCLILKS